MNQIWKHVLLGEVFESITNGVNCDQKSNTGKQLVTRIETISKGVFNLERIGRADLTEKDLSKYRMKENDILFSHINSPIHVGKTALFEIDEEVYHGVNLLRIRTIKEVEPKFLRYFLLLLYTSGFWRTVAKQSVNQASVNQKDISAVPFSYPTLEKQREIVKKLDSAFAEFDLMEEALSLSISKSNELMQSLLSASLVSSEAELKSSNSSGKQIFDMKTFKLSEVCSFSRGLTYSKGDEVEYSSNVVLRANNIDLASNSLNLEDLRYIKESIQIKKEKIAKKDSIIICTASGSKSHVGKVALIDEDYQYAFGGFMGQITPLSNCHHKYLYYILTSGSFKEYLMNLNDGTNINNLKFSDIEDYEFPMPSLENQLKIVKKLDRAFIEIESLKSQIGVRQSFASVLRQSLLSSVFIKVDEVA